MDNRTIRNALTRRIPEVYFIGKPWKQAGKVYWLMYAKVPGIRRPVEIIADMPDTAILSHRELLNTMISEVADELKALRTGKKNLVDRPDEEFPPLSAEGQKVFDNDGIQYISVGAPNVDPKPKLIVP